jgi:hypothetical protein
MSCTTREANRPNENAPSHRIFVGRAKLPVEEFNHLRPGPRFSGAQQCS